MMWRKIIADFLFFMVVFAFLACVPRYPSYDSIVKSRNQIEPIRFEKEKWFDDEGIGVESLWKNRPALARDLINRNLLIGKSYAEVQELLGKTEIDEKNNSVSYDIYVDLGVVDPVFVEKLVIKFDKNEKVENAEIKIRMMDGHPDYR